MDTNINSLASTGEPKVFYCKVKVPEVLQRQAPLIQKVLKTVEAPDIYACQECRSV